MRTVLGIVGVYLPEWNRVNECCLGQQGHKFWRGKRGGWCNCRDDGRPQILYRSPLSLFTPRRSSIHANTASCYGNQMVMDGFGVGGRVCTDALGMQPTENTVSFVSRYSVPNKSVRNLDVLQFLRAVCPADKITDILRSDGTPTTRSRTLYDVPRILRSPL
jgi:hypothetical protein